jgi:hypothetical protein
MIPTKRLIDGQPHDLIPIRDFRATHNLPDTFGVAYFEPKDTTDLGHIDTPEAGAALNMVRATVLGVLPLTRAKMAATEWLRIVPGIAKLFESKLTEANSTIGLREQEIGFAVSGFADVCNAVAYALIRARTGGPQADFDQIYDTWLNNSVRASQTVHTYTHKDANWQVRLLNDAYGRLGLIVRLSDADDGTASIVYVEDKTLACPAEGFMARLLADVGVRMIDVTPE